MKQAGCGTVVALVLVATIAASRAGAAPADSCADLVPKSLRTAIARSYPGSVLARESDYDSQTIASELQYRDGNRCLGAAIADVNGDGRNDFVLLIASKTRDAVIVGALARAGGRWRLSTLETFSEDSNPRQQFVNKLKPGTYADMYAIDDAPDEYRPEPGRVRRYTSRRPGFAAGKLEASEVAHFYTGTRWVHVWLSD